MISSVSQSGLTGIQAGMESLRQSASEIASARREDGSSLRDVAKPLVDQKEGLLQVQASAKVLSASDEAIGRLIDEFA
jgi:hypothetical protein